MTQTQLLAQLEKWKRLLLVYSGATVTLLVIALVEMPVVMLARTVDRAVAIDGWYGVWFVLQLACLTPGIMLLLWPTWRAVPLSQRINSAFGFLAASWTALVAFDMRVAGLDLPPLFHFIVLGLGVTLIIAYLLARRRVGVGGELFP